MSYTPPFTITAPIVEIGQALGRLSAQQDSADLLRLRRINRIRTVRGSLAIEGNTVSEEQMIEMTVPDRLSSRFQKYRLTGKGKALVKA